MVHLELTPDDAEILRAALESYLSDLRVEIVHTDSRDFREGLKRQQAALTEIADGLAAALASPRPAFPR